jgi:hypothetical protein
MEISLADAYRLACQQLGEALVREQALIAEVQRLTPPPSPTHGPQPGGFTPIGSLPGDL